MYILPEKFSGWPCVRWPPCARFMPSTVSPGLQRGHIDGHIRLRARMRLHVGVLGAEKLLRAVDRKLLGVVHEFAAAVIALRRIALGVFVREHRAHRFEHRFGDEIFRGNQLEAGGLAAHFVAQSPPRFPDPLRPAADSFFAVRVCNVEVSLVIGAMILSHAEGCRRPASYRAQSKWGIRSWLPTSVYGGLRGFMKQRFA